MFDRKKIIDELITSDMEWFGIDTNNLGYRLWLRKVCSALTDEQLIQECEERDISYLFGECDDV